MPHGSRHQPFGPTPTPTARDPTANDPQRGRVSRRVACLIRSLGCLAGEHPVTTDKLLAVAQYVLLAVMIALFVLAVLDAIHPSGSPVCTHGVY